MIDDVAVTWKVVMTWHHMDADMDSDVASDMASNVNLTAHFWMGPIQLGLISAQYLLLANKIQLIHNSFTKTKVTAQKSQ